MLGINDSSGSYIGAVGRINKIDGEKAIRTTIVHRGHRHDGGLTGCLTEMEADNLRLYFLGQNQLSDFDLESMAPHLDVCDDCRKIMRDLCGDAIMVGDNLSRNATLLSIFEELNHSPIHRSTQPDLSWCDRVGTSEEIFPQLEPPIE